MSPHEQHLLEARPNKRGPKYNTMQRKPDLANVKPEELDDNTLRNMNAIGINFAAKHSNKLKPFETRASRNRKWRNGTYENDRNKVGKSMNKNEDIADYDGSINAEKSKILSRRLTAWPTFEEASGFGSEPTRVVGTVATTNSNAIDQTSYMQHTELFGSKPETSGTDQTLDTLPADVRNIETPGVKSAVGCSRVVARIHLKRLIEKSQVNAATQGMPMMVDPALRERALQTQGCQRTNRMDKNQPNHTNKIATAKRSSISPSRDFDNGIKTAPNKVRN